MRAWAATAWVTLTGWSCVRGLLSTWALLMASMMALCGSAGCRSEKSAVFSASSFADHSSVILLLDVTMAEGAVMRGTVRRCIKGSSHVRTVEFAFDPDDLCNVQVFAREALASKGAADEGEALLFWGRYPGYYGYGTEPREGWFLRLDSYWFEVREEQARPWRMGVVALSLLLENCWAGDVEGFLEILD